MSTPDVATTNIADNLAAVHKRIADAALRANRDPAEITLVAVSKTKPFAAIEAALQTGQLDFGENRLEELWQKVEMAQAKGHNAIRWHMIGSIQSRKTQQVIGPFALVHSVDRLKIAERLNRDAEGAHCVLSILLQVNVSGEESKHGFSAAELKAALPQLLAMSNLRIEGLMTMAPFVEDPEETRPVFRAMRQLRDEVQKVASELKLPPNAGNSSAPHLSTGPYLTIGPHLSMGMTNDFEVAIEEGATIVRIGSAIFGDR